MTQFFEISKANMAPLYRLAGLPEGEAMVFPVKVAEPNLAGGKGFDVFFVLNVSNHPELQLGKEHTVAAHRGRLVEPPKLPCLKAATAEYSSIIRSWLTAKEIAQVRAGSADVDDFCDANMAMLAAVEKLQPAFELDAASVEQAAFFDQMWVVAKQEKYR